MEYKEQVESQTEERPLRILTLDGGGIRGLCSLKFLERLEKEIGKPIYEQFDLIGGTSTGGIIAAAMTCDVLDPGNQFTYDRKASEKVPSPFKPIEMMRFYEEFSSEVFSWGNMRYGKRVLGYSKYSPKTLENLMKKHFGENTYLNHGESKPKTNMFCVSTAYAGDPFMFRSYPVPVGKGDKAHRQFGEKVEIWKACRATSAAPTYFDPIYVQPEVDATLMTKDWLKAHPSRGPVKLVDGGVSFNNPTGLAMAEAKRIWPNRKVGLVVSVGTGKSAHVDPGSWYNGTAAFLVQAVSSSRTMHSMVKEFSKSLHFGYVRLNADIGTIDLDETNRDTLQKMIQDTEQTINSSKGSQKIEKFKDLWYQIEENRYSKGV